MVVRMWEKNNSHLRGLEGKNNSQQSQDSCRAQTAVGRLHNVDVIIIYIVEALSFWNDHFISCGFGMFYKRKKTFFFMADAKSIRTKEKCRR